MKKALIYGVISSFFFAFTFILNRSMGLSGGYWLWSACLRYLFMLPLLFVITLRNQGVSTIVGEIKKKPFYWILWSTVGFGFFYVPLSLSSNYGESWMIAASWQLTIVAGILLTPLFGQKIPKKNVWFTCLILLGVFLLQFQSLNNLDIKGTLFAFLLILIAAFSYPLGNRKMMQVCSDSLTAIQRVFGMTLCSMPFWIILSVVAFQKVGIPSQNQILQSIAVALCSGVIATVLFFKATDMVRDNSKQLALIEATQSGEVIFTLLGGILVLGDSFPGILGMFGIALILLGMICNSVLSWS